jgi:signal transduction histidine kinase
MPLKNLTNKIKKFLLPKNKDDDLRRRELILNTLLFFSIGAFLFLNIIRLIDLFTQPNDRGLPIMYTLIILLFFCFLLWLAKQGKIRTASWFLILAYSAPLIYSFVAWGADLPAALILTVLIIILCGILLGSSAVFLSAFIINFGLIILTYYQANGLIKVNGYWRLEKHEVGDALAYAAFFMIITVITWIFVHEIKKALTRARQSEAALRQERDSLEIRVIEKTEALRQTEAEKINQLYRLAEFGRLSSGIFHDLINPLTAISLNLEQIKNEGETEDKNEILSAKSYLNQALIATRRMENLIASIKKQIQRESNSKSFSLNEEITQILQILAFKARRARVLIDTDWKEEVRMTGDAVKFGQIITNLLCNAIEACAGEGGSEEKKILVSLEKEKEQVILTVNDNGPGIAPENINKIFISFFSTKKEISGGLGLGLSSTKNLIEKTFKGSIEVKSELGQGAKFLIKLPLIYEN